MENILERWKDGYTIALCMKQMTSREFTERAVRELIEYHVKAALKAGGKAWMNETEGMNEENAILTAYPESLIK